MREMILPNKDDLHYCTSSYIPKFDSVGNVDLHDLMLQFQNLAGKHIENLGLGDDFKNKNSIFYILCRVKGYFLSEITDKETYTFVTYPVQASSIQLYRYAYILDSKGKPVFYLLSLWVLMDQKTRRLQSAKAFREILKLAIPDIEETKPLSDERLDEMDFADVEFQYQSSYVVNSDDIDSNQHMNNTVYMRLAQEKCILKPISVFEIDFVKECYLNETINLVNASVENSYYVIGRKNDGLLSFMAKFSTAERF